MQTEFLDELGDTLFAVALAGAIGLGAANLAIRVNQERTAFDAARTSQAVGQPAYPTPSTATKDARPGETTDQLNF
jgi:hypothetical protein